MSRLDYIHDLTEFTTFWKRAREGVRALAGVPREELLYFDPIDISTQKFFDLVQALLAFQSNTEFVTLILSPDPFSGVCACPDLLTETRAPLPQPHVTTTVANQKTQPGFS